MLLDTDVLVDFLRGYPPAVGWLTGLTEPVAIPGLVAMELLQGCRNQNEQLRVLRQIQRFSLHWPTASDCNRALLDFVSYRLSHGLEILDALVGHTAAGLAEPLATFNTKHYGVVALLKTVQPY